MEMYQKLFVNKKQHTHTNVPNGYKEVPKLASWVTTQRTYYRGKDLCVDRIALLTSLGFVWYPKQKK